MTNFLLTFILALISTKAGFQSHDGSNCAFVYDADVGSTFPLDVCITDYDKDHAMYQYTSREYICTTNSDGSADIEVYTYYKGNCTGDSATSRSALGSDNNVYRCGDGVSDSYDDCYLEYKQYDIGDENEDCSGWSSDSFTTQYVIVGACIPISHVQFSRCTSVDVSYVEFNDDECCDLSYTYTAYNGPDWSAYDIQPGCDSANGIYIDEDSWNCMSVLLSSEYTDNTASECIDDAHCLVPNVVITVILGAVMFIHF